jgi:hypothetical protein
VAIPLLGKTSVKVFTKASYSVRFSFQHSSMKPQIPQLSLLFADNMKLITNFTSAQHSIQRNLGSISKWTDQWVIKLNIIQRQHLTIKASHTGPTTTFYIILGDQTHQIIQSTAHRDLGIIMHSNCSFNNHHATITMKANRILIYRIFNHLDTSSLETI